MALEQEDAYEARKDKETMFDKRKRDRKHLDKVIG
jgi:hypothetical protein